MPMLVVNVDLSNEQDFDVFGTAPPTFTVTAEVDHYSGDCELRRVSHTSMVTRRLTVFRGDCVKLSVSGTIRRFSWSKLLATLVSYSFLLGASQAAISLVA